MTRVVYESGALDDLERLAEFLVAEDPKAAAETAPLIVQCIETLRLHPLIGRGVGGPYRELLIFRGRSGYVVTYRFDAVPDVVRILGIRHQREAAT